MLRRPILLLCLVALLLPLGLPVGALAQAPAVLGEGGAVYRVLTGPPSALVAGAGGATASNVALVLEIEPQGAATQRLVVPGTEGEEVERYPSLTLDPASGRVFVVWEARRTIHSTLHVTSYHEGDWSPVVEISGDPFSDKLNPRLAATSDAFTSLDLAGQPVSRTRTVLHLVWFDRAGYGDRPLYTPLVVEDGVLVSGWSVIALPDLLPPADAATAPPLGLIGAPVVDRSGDAHSVTIGFVDPATARVATLVSSVAPGGLTTWTDQARHSIIDVGRNVASRRQLAVTLEPALGALAERLLPADLAQFLTQRCVDLLSASDPGVALEAAAEKIHDQLVQTAARLGSGPRAITGDARHGIIDVGRRSTSERSLHLATIGVGSVRGVPSLPARPIVVLTSPDGRDVILAWDREGAVEYRQSQGEGWSDMRTLNLGARLAREDAYRLLAERLERR